MDVYIGFDSAWTNSRKAPGAICAVCIDEGNAVGFHPPRLVSFTEALAFIEEVRSDSGVTLIALDQPTVVPNMTGMRPVERVAASLISWLGGGVQPANRGRLGMFCNAAPIWRFLDEVRALEDPDLARTAENGLYLMEVFPALALASMGFFGRLARPRYNPARRKIFRLIDWRRVGDTAAQRADGHGCGELAEWCRSAAAIMQPRKLDQDKLDAALCVLIALHWRLRSRDESVILGDLANGYMVAPATAEVRERLSAAASKYGVAMNGVISSPHTPMT
jgi:predicted RNase H-like nuclease